MWRIVSFLILIVLFASCHQQTYSKSYTIGKEDRSKVDRIYHVLKGLPDEDLQTRIKVVQEFFIGMPYVANSLDKTIDEKVVLSLHGFDCVTFVESVLALASLDSLHDDYIHYYGQNIEALRYREGDCKGYASRLHYFSDWLAENKKHHWIKEIIPPGLTKDYIPDVSYMSSHPESYNQLKGNDLLIDSIRFVEENMRHLKFNMVPQSEIKKINAYVRDGDVIAIVTNIEGLDITHTGFARFQKGELHFLHASSNYHKVLISEQGLADYVNGNSHMVGILIFRPLVR